MPECLRLVRIIAHPVGAPRPLREIPPERAVAGYGASMMAINPLELLLLVLVIAVPVAVGYLVIRVGVRHGVMDADRRRGRRPDPSA